MQEFMGKDFLLESDTARRLYHEYAASWPICDYHCHISPDLLADNKNFTDLADVWLGGDHYKWRAMRLAGIPERLITGDADPEEKFNAWAELLPWLIGNPLHNWTHLELQRYFGIDDLLNPQTAKSIWQKANDALARPDFRPLHLLDKFNVTWLCTTDDPLDSLTGHQQLSQRKEGVKVVPAFRPDRFLKITLAEFPDLISQLSGLDGSEISSYVQLVSALSRQIDRFHLQGCRLSDHALDILPGVKANQGQASRVFETRLNGGKLTNADISCFQASLLHDLAEQYYRLHWTMQLHIGAKRNASTRAFKALGADTGFDVMQDRPIADDLVCLLDNLEQSGHLPRTLLYTLNAKDNMTLATIASAFAGEGQPSWVNVGPAWWFHDQLDGMLLHLKQLCQVGVIKTFVGMTTDSRSLLSYTRHEYFRRLFCNQIAIWVENGTCPADYAILEKLIGLVSYQNAAKLLTD